MMSMCFATRQIVGVYNQNSCRVGEGELIIQTDHINEKNPIPKGIGKLGRGRGKAPPSPPCLYDQSPVCIVLCV